MNLQLVPVAGTTPTNEIERIKEKLAIVRRAFVRNNDSFEFWADQALALSSVGEAVDGLIRTLQRSQRPQDLGAITRITRARHDAQEALALVSLVELVCDQPSLISCTPAERALPHVLGFAADRLDSLHECFSARKAPEAKP